MKPQKNKLLLLSLMIMLVAPWAAVSAQSVGGKLHTVVVGQDDLPLGAASISLLRIPGDIPLKGTLSKENGDIEFVEVPSGKYMMQVSAVGYTTYRSTEIALKAGGDHVFGYHSPASGNTGFG